MKRGIRPKALLVLFIMLGLLFGLSYFFVIVPENERDYLRVLSGSEDEISPLIALLFFIQFGIANGLVLGYFIVPEGFYLGPGSHERYNPIIRPIAVLLFLSIFGIAISYIIGYFLVPERWDWGGPFFGSRKESGSSVGCCFSSCWAFAGLFLGGLWIAWRAYKGKLTPIQEENRDKST